MPASQQEPVDLTDPVLRNLHVAIVAIVEAGSEIAESDCTAGGCAACPFVTYSMGGNPYCGIEDLKGVLSRMGPGGSTAARRRRC